MKWSEEDMDQVIFDYLEGELLLEKRRKLEVDILRNNALRDEFELWKSSYVSSDYYDTSLLEGRLVSPQQMSPFSSFTFYLNTMLIVAISFVSSIRVQIEPEIVTVKSPIPATIVSKKTTLNSGRHVTALPLTLKKVPKASTESDLFPILNEVMAESLERQPLLWSKFQVNPKRTIEIKTIKLPAKPKEKDRRTLRQIDRMKGRFERERKAAEFMRGDIPYVVPVDTQNF